MEGTLVAIAIKGDQSKSALVAATKGLASVYDFKVPADGLRVGTLDSLVSLSDDLVKIDMLSEATVLKIYRQLSEMGMPTPSVIGGAHTAPLPPRARAFAPHPRLSRPAPLSCEPPTARAVDIVTYTTKQWEWDEAKFQLKTPLREQCESISGRIAR